MAKTPSPTNYVILGLLGSGPKSGYEIKADLERATSHFWSESYGQIYPALKRLHTQGLVEKASSPAGDRKRFVYSITGAGRRALHEWLSLPASPGPVRDELTLKVFLGAYGDHEALLGHLDAAAMEFEGKAAELEGAATWLQDTHRDHPEYPYWRICLDRGVRVAKARGEWARHALDILSERDAVCTED